MDGPYQKSHLISLQVRKLNNTMEKLTKMPVSRKTEMQATKKILAVIGVFFLCNFFNGLFGIIVRIASIDSHLTMILSDISIMLITLNCSVNVIIYGIFDPKFRQIFFELFCSCSQTKKNKMNLIQMDRQNVTKTPFSTSKADSNA